jgi:hypothetical protein
VPADLQRLIGEMASANRTWGEERIVSELLLKLGADVASDSATLYANGRPASRWRAVRAVEHLCSQTSIDATRTAFSVTTGS